MLQAKNAVFEQLAGWERPLWFAGDAAPDHPLSFRRTAAQAWIAREARAVRERVGILDLSGFAKLDVIGPDAARLLDRLVCGRLPAPGRTALAYILTRAGTIEAEITCTRLAEDHLLLLFAALDEQRVIDRLEVEARGRDLRIVNLSDALGCLLVAGPLAREVIGSLTDQDLSPAAFPRLAVRRMTVAGIGVRALRVALVGEVSFELYAPMSELPALYRAIWAAGERVGIADFGTAALNGMRLEMGHRGTAELNAATCLIDTGMMRFTDLAKGDFVGRAALVARLAAPPAWTCCHLELADGDADCHGGEAVLSGGRIVGSVSSGGFGPYVEKSLAFAFVQPDCLRADAEMGVMVLGEVRQARVLRQAAYRRPERARMPAPVARSSKQSGGTS